MAQLTTVTISYRRQAQPAQYEAEEVRLEGSFSVQEDEDFEAVAYDMVARARVQAHRVLGLAVPEIADFVPYEGVTVERTTATEEKPKRKRRTKAEMEAAAATPAEVDVMAEPEKKPAPAATDAGVDYVMDFEIPAAEEKVIEISEIQSIATKIAQTLGSPTPIQEIMLEYGVRRIGDLLPEKRASFVERLKSLKKD